MRLFVALEIPTSIRNALAALIKELRSAAPKVKWVRPENLHVTLKFMGEAAPEKLDAIRAALSGLHSPEVVELRFRGLGFFPNEKRPRVFWAGMEASPNLAYLASGVDKALAALGFPLETREFTPHLTLARFDHPGIPTELRAAVERNTVREFGTLRSGEFHLIESKLKSSGAEYTTLQSFGFAAEA